MTKIISSTGVILNRNGKILLGRRKSKHGQGSGGPSGGKLDYFETFENCAIRETFEELV